MDDTNKGPITIGIDARFYGPIGKGLGRYTKEIVDRVVAMDQVNRYVIFLVQENFKEFSTSNPRVKKVLTPVRWYTWREQIFLPFLIWREKIDLMHWPHFNVPIFCPTDFIITIHDLILTKFPTQRASTLNPILYWFKNLAYNLVIRVALKRAKNIIAVSEFTKQDIVNKFTIAAEKEKNKIKVIYEGVADTLFSSNSNNDKNVIFSYNISSPYLLYVGNAYPHKNLEKLIEIFSKIREEKLNLQLILVGKEDYFYKSVKLFAKKFDPDGKFIIFPGFVSDRELAVLYRQALAYVFPSQYEGFGLPPLEAMANGCPVVASNKSSLPEILGPAALYFNPEDDYEMKKQIDKIIDDNDWRQNLINLGYQQVKKYSWETSARETLALYNSFALS